MHFSLPPCLSLSNSVSLSFPLAAQELQVRFLTLTLASVSCGVAGSLFPPRINKKLIVLQLGCRTALFFNILLLR